MFRTRVKTALVAITLCLTMPSLVLAQPGGGRGGRGPGGPGGPADMFGGILGLIQQRDVQREIELSADQEDQLRTLGETLRDEMRGEMQGLFGGMRGLSDEERQARFEEIRARMEELRKDVEARIGKVLLPHQFERLRQIDLQSRLQRGGAAALTESELAETLGLSQSQRDELRERAEQVEQDLQAKIRQLRLDARNQVLDVLTADQRVKLEAMMGEQFDLPEGGPGFGRGGGRFGFGDRGGRGGRGRGNRNNAPAAENPGN